MYRYNRQPQRNVRQQPDAQEIMGILRTQHDDLYSQLEQAGMNRGITDYLFLLVVNYTLNPANRNRSANQIYNQFQNQVPWLNLFLRQLNIPRNVIDQILIRVIQITLNELQNGGQQPGSDWVGWEDLGGVLTSAPTVSS